MNAKKVDVLCVAITVSIVVHVEITVPDPTNKTAVPEVRDKVKRPFKTRQRDLPVRCFVLVEISREKNGRKKNSPISTSGMLFIPLNQALTVKNFFCG